MNKTTLSEIFIAICLFLLLSCQQEVADSFDMDAYLKLADEELIYPTEAQIAMLKTVVPKENYSQVPSISDRTYWDGVSTSESGQKYLKAALALIDKTPEIPITDAIYRRANKEGNRGIYKPRYYRTMDCFEHFVIAECIENNGRFIPQIEVYADSIMAMKSWMHPNHDDKENSVLEGKRVSIDLGARKFGLILALATDLLEDKIPAALQQEMKDQIQWRITDSYLRSCKGIDRRSNTWIKSTSNWNSVCTSGSVFSVIVASDSYDERIAAIGCALNSMVYFVSGFGEDGYCSEGTGYWNYGFGHYLYLAHILHDYTDGKVDLFTFNNPDKLRRVGHFPQTFQVNDGLYAPFADGVTRLKGNSDNFAFFLAAKYYGAPKPLYFKPDESVQELIAWYDKDAFTPATLAVNDLPDYTYFDDFGIVISRGTQEDPLSFVIKGGHNAENHNHSDVGTYVITMGDEVMSGDIGAPSYTAGAFSKTNKARSSWGHPVPRINNTLQSNGMEYHGKVLDATFDKAKDHVVMDIKPAYELAQLETLQRTIDNDKNANGVVTVTDVFKASENVVFGSAVMVNLPYEIINDSTFVISSDLHKVQVIVASTGGDIVINDEVVPVEKLRSGKKSYRIGLDFTAPVKEGTISVTYTPIDDKVNL